MIDTIRGHTLLATRGIIWSESINLHNWSRSLRSSATICFKFSVLRWGLRSRVINRKSWHEPPHDITNKLACAPSEDSDQPRHPPSLIRVFPVRTKKAWVLSYPLSAQRKLWSDWADAQADLSLRWAHMPFCVAHVFTLMADFGKV